MTVAENIANQLFDFGVRYVYGIPGGPSIHYMEAFKAAGIEFILTSDENAAGIMACVSGRLTGIPGICHATLGPGATNLLTATGAALLDRSPVIVFTSEMPDSLLHRTVQMNVDHQKLFEPITKRTFRINMENAGEVLDNSIRFCSEEYPGPIHIGLPSDIANLETHVTIHEAAGTEIPGFENEISRIIDLLEKSRRPLMAIGLTSARFGLRKKINDFLSINRIPVEIGRAHV
jgi:acetolactate synthase I/II/III large subunit